MFLNKQSDDRRRILFSFGLPLIFLLVYVLFDILYSALPDAALNRWLYEPFVSFCVGLIHWITPDHNVWAVQNKILSAEGNLEMVRTCDGSYSFILLAAAMAVFKAPIRVKLFGMAGAFLLVVCLNLLRIVTLFFVLIHCPTWFDFVHYYFAPYLSLGAYGLFFSGWAFRARKPASHEL